MPAEWLKKLKIVTDPTRFNILQLLLSHDFCVSTLARQLKLSEAAVSQHLQILRKYGLVSGDKRGYYTHYRVNRAIFRELAENLQELAAQQDVTPYNCDPLETDEHNCCRKEEEPHEDTAMQTP